MILQCYKRKDQRNTSNEKPDVMLQSHMMKTIKELIRLKIDTCMWLVESNNSVTKT